MSSTVSTAGIHSSSFPYSWAMGCVLVAPCRYIQLGRKPSKTGGLEDSTFWQHRGRSIIFHRQ